MAYDRQWLIDLLRRLGYEREAEDAAQELPAQVSLKELQDFGDRHGINRDQIIDQMGGSP
jgi:hypothetical protein